MDLQHFEYRQEGKVGILTINRPAKLNAFSEGTLKELDQAVYTLSRDDSVFVIILTGSGEKAFCVGADLAEAREESSDPVNFTRFGQGVLLRLENMGKPVIAAINGFALGGGCETALACTLRVASETAQFGLPELGLAVMPGWGGTQRLPRLIGKGRALELLLTGRRMGAQEALTVGLVNKVVPPAELLSASMGLANTITEKAAPLSARMAIRAVNAGMELPLDHATLLEAHLAALLHHSEDFQEGGAAFREKRKPQFKGR